jgi:hypothetical protein
VTAPDALTDERLLWIFGSSRSGSSWLMRMLGDLAGAVTIDDPHLGHHLGVWRPLSLAWATGEDDPPELRTLNEIKGPKRSYFFNDRYREAWEPALRQLVLSRFGAEVDEVVARAEAGGPAPGCPVLVKEPGSQAAGELTCLFPRSGLIFLLRDGRDVVDSWLAAYQGGSWAQGEGAYELADSGRLAMIRWQAAVWAYRTLTVAAAFERHRGRKVMVRYEDLLGDPLGELARVAEHLALPATPEAVAGAVDRHRFEEVPTSQRGPLQAVREGAPGGWRRNLSPAEQHVLQEALAPVLDRFGFAGAGYALDDARAS